MGRRFGAVRSADSWLPPACLRGQTVPPDPSKSIAPSLPVRAGDRVAPPEDDIRLARPHAIDRQLLMGAVGP